MAKATAGSGKGQSARETERRDKRAAEGETETTGLAYVNTSRKSMCVNGHMCVHNHINVACLAYTDA